MHPPRWLALFALITSMTYYAPNAYPAAAPAVPKECHIDTGESPFSPSRDKDRLRILVANYSSSVASRQFGGSAFADRLSGALAEYISNELRMGTSGITMDHFDIKRIDCSIGDHGSALDIGRKVDAHIVFWGYESQVSGGHKYRQSSAPNTCKQEYNIIGSERAVMNISSCPLEQLLPTAKNYYSHITITSHAGLYKESSHWVTAEEPQELLGRDLPRLLSRDIRLLFDFALGIFAFRTERYGLATQLMARSTSKIPKGTDRRHELFQLLGRSHVLAGNLDQAAAAFKAAYDQCPPGDRGCQGVQHTYLGWTMIFQQKQAEATAQLQEAVQLLQDARDYYSLGAAIHKQGLLALINHQYQAAKDFFHRSLNIRAIVNDEFGMMLTRNNLALTYQSSGDFAAARSELTQVYEYFMKTGSLYGLGRSANNLGLLYMQLQEIPLAQRYFGTAIDAGKKTGDRRLLARAYYNQGKLSLATNEARRAAENFNAAKQLQHDLQDHFGLAHTYSNLAQIEHSNKNRMAATKLYVQALDEISKLANTDKKQASTLQTTIQYNLAIIFFEDSQLDRAESTLRATKNRGEFLDLSQQVDVYTLYAEVLEARGESEPAMRILEESAEILKTNSRYREAWSALEKAIMIYARTHASIDAERARLRDEQRKLWELFPQTSPSDRIARLPEEISAEQQRRKEAEENQKKGNLLHTAQPVDACNGACEPNGQPQPSPETLEKRHRSERPRPGPPDPARRVPPPMPLPPIDTSSPLLRYSPPAAASQPPANRR